MSENVLDGGENIGWWGLGRKSVQSRGLVVLVLVVEDRNSMWAGLRRSIETVSWRPLRSMVKCLSVRLIIRNGPSYGGQECESFYWWNGWDWLEIPKLGFELVDKCGGVWPGRELVGEGEKNSPGRRRVVPKMSELGAETIDS